MFCRLPIRIIDGDRRVFWPFLSGKWLLKVTVLSHFFFACQENLSTFQKQVSITSCFFPLYDVTSVQAVCKLFSS